MDVEGCSTTVLCYNNRELLITGAPKSRDDVMQGHTSTDFDIDMAETSAQLRAPPSSTMHRCNTTSAATSACVARGGTQKFEFAQATPNETPSDEGGSH